MIWTGYKTRSFSSFRFNSFCWAVCIVWLVLVGFGWFSLIRAENQSPFVLLDLLIFYKYSGKF